MRKIGVLTSGGDAPGMNACLRAIVRAACLKGAVVIGIRKGYSGLFSRETVELGVRSVSNILQLGGTFLETSRNEEMKRVEGRKKAIQFLNSEGIEGLITIGGEGTFKGAAALAEEGGIKIIGVPGTIDNDVYGTDFCIGFDTAVNTALESIDKIRDTANSLDRLFFVEVMGRTRGFIALEVGIAAGAEEILVPELKTDLDSLCRVINETLQRGKRSLIVVVSEGDVPGGAIEIARNVTRCVGVESRVTILGHVQRGGSPTARDRILASRLGVSAVDALLSGRSGYMVGEVKGETVLTPLRDTWEKEKPLNNYDLHLAKILAT